MFAAISHHLPTLEAVGKVAKSFTFGFKTHLTVAILAVSVKAVQSGGIVEKLAGIGTQVLILGYFYSKVKKYDKSDSPISSLKKSTLRTLPPEHLPDETNSQSTLRENNLGLSLKRNVHGESSVQQIQLFWDLHIRSFKISHGTSCLYLKHFKEYGLGTHYPLALKNIILEIRKVWANHQFDILERTENFSLFETRYDQADQRKTVEFSFSAKQSITQQFTTGSRRGGEWIRELRFFLKEANKKKEVLSKDELRTIMEVESLINLMDSVPPLIVKVSAACPDIHGGFGIGSPFFCPLQEFINFVKQRCEDWQDPNQLAEYLNTTLLSMIKIKKDELENKYEITLRNPVHPEYLEFEIVTKADSVQSSIPASNDYPRLEIDKPRKLTILELCQLRLEFSGFADIIEYQDSRFQLEAFHEDRVYVVTRKKCTEEDYKELALRNAKREMLKVWIKTFGCESLMK